MPGRDRMLAVRGLSVTFESPKETRTLVAGVDLHIDRGESVALVGESGSGKSLTARSLVGLLPEGIQARGTIEYNGASGALHEPEGLPRRLRGSEIALLMQDPFTSLNPLMRCGAQVLEAKPLRGLSKRQRREEARRRLAEVGITAHNAEARYPFEFSGGMRQRVALAAALATNPSVLIADEFTTALDVTTQKAVLDLVRSIQRQRGMGLMIITHDLRMAFAMCERVYVMYAGSLMETGRPAAIARAPTHPYTLSLTMAEPSLDGVVAQAVMPPAGETPTPDAHRDRCAFAHRCVWQREACLRGKPSLVQLSDDGASACVRQADIRGEMQRARIEAGAQVTSNGAVRDIASHASPLLVVEDLGKTFTARNWTGRREPTVALDKVSLTVGHGESVGIVGESGSGKTTLARCIVGLEQADDGGYIELDGRDISSWSSVSGSSRRALRQLVQYVFQDPYSSLNPMRSVGATLREAVSAHQELAAPAVRRRVSELLDLVGLPEAYARRKPSALSGGERQRVAIARALALEPKLVICDEPVSALDVSVQAQILELLRSLRSTLGLGYLFISHDLAVVRQVADRVVVMNRGRIVETGTAESVLEAPSHEYTRQLVASSPGRWQALAASRSTGPDNVRQHS